MSSIDSSLFDLSRFDTLSRRDTPIHRLDPRVKVLATISFIVAVMSFDKYSVSALLPFFLYPIIFIALGDIPVSYLAGKVLLAAPFAFFIGVFNPFLDQHTRVSIGPVGITGGWISFASIMIRFVLTVTAALALVATTGMYQICNALERLFVPKVFTVQLLFLYRYLFVLVEEASRMRIARSLRSFHSKGTGLKVYAYMIGHLLLRTVDRAQRIHIAMRCRGFDGDIRAIRVSHRRLFPDRMRCDLCPYETLQPY